MKIYRRFVLNTVGFILFGWGLKEMYSVYSKFAYIMKHPTPPWEVTMNLTPIFGLFLLGLIYLLIMLKKKKNIFSKIAFLPYEFEESDEREKYITAKACRASYISMWYTFPILACFLMAYPFISDKIPYYPIIVLLLLPFIQTIAYFFTWKKYY